MEINIDARRKEAVLLLLTVIVLAILVSLLSNVLFDLYYSTNKTAFTIIILVLLIGTSVLSYFAIITKTTKTIISIEFPYCFSKNEKKFIDIESCVPSIHARVHFDQLPEGYKKEMVKFDAPSKFWESDLDNFVHNATQAIFLDLVFGGASYVIETENLLPYKDLPETIKRNDCVKRHAVRDDEYSLVLPKWAKIQTYGELERFIKVKSKYGELTVGWEIGFGNTAHYSSSYLTAIGIDPEKDAHEFIVNATLTYTTKFAYMHKKELDEYINWAQVTQRKFSELDWHLTREQLPLVIMQMLINESRSSIAPVKQKNSPTPRAADKGGLSPRP